MRAIYKTTQVSIHTQKNIGNTVLLKSCLQL